MLTNQHIPYEQIKNRPCDFIVAYRFYSKEEGGRQTGTPVQGYRSDFMYSEDEVPDKKKCVLWMIHPEFMDDEGVMTDKTVPVPETGRAQMWIINESFYEMHKSRIKLGQKGFFMEGSMKTAECEVVAIVNLV